MQPESSNANIEQALQSIAQAIAGAPNTAGLSGLTVLHQDDAGNVVRGNSVALTGHGKIVGNGTADIAETVTFGVTFLNVPVVLCNFIGFVPAAGAFNLAIVDGSWGGMHFVAEAPAVAAFTARGRRIDGAALGAGSDYYYSWIAIGRIA